MTTPKGCVTFTKLRKREVRFVGKYDFTEARKFLRWFYEQLHGEVSPDDIVTQSCGCPNCINPDHLITMSKSEVGKLMGAKNKGIPKANKKERPPKRVPKITNEEVRLLLQKKASMTLENKIRYAEDKGISLVYVNALLNGTSKPHIYNEVFGERKEKEREEGKRSLLWYC